MSQVPRHPAPHSGHRGAAACPSGPVPAAEIERFVVERVRALGTDPALLNAAVERMRTGHREEAMQGAGGTEEPDGGSFDEGAARLAASYPQFSGAPEDWSGGLDQS